MYWMNNKGEITHAIDVAERWKKEGMKVKQYTFVLGAGFLWETNF